MNSTRVGIFAAMITACDPVPYYGRYYDCDTAQKAFREGSGLVSTFNIHKLTRSCKTTYETIDFLFEQFSESLAPKDLHVQMVVESLKSRRNSPGTAVSYLRSVEDAANAFDWVSKNIANHEGEDVPVHPSDTLAQRRGNCKSKSYLLASILEALEGHTQLLIGSVDKLYSHMAAMVFIPVNRDTPTWKAIEDAEKYIGGRYNHGLIMLDRLKGEKGFWLFLDPTLSTIPGIVSEKNARFDFTMAFDLQKRAVRNPWSGKPIYIK